MTQSYKGEDADLSILTAATQEWSLEHKSVAEIILDRTHNPIDRISKAINLIEDKSYKVDRYLAFEGMDSISSHEYAGMSLVHIVIKIASELPRSKELKANLGKFFEILHGRILESGGEDIFNPNHSTMNPKKFDAKTDYHMISISKLMSNLKFKSHTIKNICKSHTKALEHHYQARHLDDDSGDSEDEGAPASIYKAHCEEINDFILSSGGFSNEPSDDRATRIMDKYHSDHTYFTESMDVLDSEGEFDDDKWDMMWKNLNSHEQDAEQLVNRDDLVVPLYHGVPFMHTQYTSQQRREIFERIASINRKLFAKFLGEMDEEESTFSPSEEALLNIHSRTATASARLQSLYEIMNASDEELEKLKEFDDQLIEYFRDHELNEEFATAMKHFIFGFGEDKTLEFWNEMKKASKSGEYPDEEIIKYRFPIIAASKTPDHAAKFAIGSNVEESTRGEEALKPEYDDGYPNHRLAGLLYVTLHNLDELSKGFVDGTIIDVNRSISLKEIGITSGTTASNLRNQHEVDFFGKMTGEVIAIIPILYPNVKRGDDFDPDYHQAIWGINPDASDSSIVNPGKIIRDLKSNANPSISNRESFGRLMMHSIVNLAHGIVLRACKSMDKFACQIREDKEIMPYNLTFDYKSQKTKLSEAHRELSASPKAKVDEPSKAWERDTGLNDSGVVDESSDVEMSSSESESGENVIEQIINDRRLTGIEVEEELIERLCEEASKPFDVIDEILGVPSGPDAFNYWLQIYLLSLKYDHLFEDSGQGTYWYVLSSMGKYSPSYIIEKYEEDSLHMKFFKQNFYKQSYIDFVLENYHDIDIVRMGIEEYGIDIEELRSRVEGDHCGSCEIEVLDYILDELRDEGIDIPGFESSSSEDEEMSEDEDSGNEAMYSLSETGYISKEEDEEMDEYPSSEYSGEEDIEMPLMGDE